MPDIAFPWYGGKFSHLKWLLPLIPYSRHYCEPYAGSAAVLLNRKPSPIEIYNDLNGDVARFFRVLRDRTDELVRMITLTPYSRDELRRSFERTDDELEAARRFYVRARQVRSGLGQVRWEGSWSYETQTYGRLSDHAVVISRWMKAPGDLVRVAARLKNVQIENRPALDVMRRTDREDMLYYVDPPYLLSTRTGKRAYEHEMTSGDHEDMAGALRALTGTVVLSGYRSDAYDEWFAGWRRVDGPIKRAPSSTVMGDRQECVWISR